MIERGVELSLWGKKVCGAHTEVWNDFESLSLIVKIPKLPLAPVRGNAFRSKVRNPVQERKQPSRGGVRSSLLQDNFQGQH